MVSILPLSSPGVNSVVAHDDYIEVIWDGAQDATKVRQTNLESLKAAEFLKSKNKPILLSLSIRNHPTMPDVGAFHEILKVFRAITFDRVAISGSISPRIMTLVSTITGSFNKEMEISYFTDPNEALSWLKSHSK